MYPRFYRRAFLLATVAVLGYLLLQLLEPLWGPIGWAVILSFMLHPLHQWLTRKFKGKAGVAAGTLTALTPFGVIAPLLIFTTIFARQVALLVDYLREQQMTSYPVILARVEQIPLIGRLLAWVRMEVPISAEQVQAWVTNSAQSMLKSAAAVSGSVALGIVGTLVGFFLTLFLLFFFLRDGRMLLAHGLRLIPMTVAQRGKLTTYLTAVMNAVIFGHVLTAVIQGTLVGIGFAIAGLPSPLVFGVFAGIAAFIPAAGTGLVLVPAVLYLAFAGHWGAAIFLGVWSLLVGFSDNFMRPYLTRQRADVSTLTVFIGVIGGISAFGFIGSLLGPVLLALIVALLRFAEDSITKKD